MISFCKYVTRRLSFVLSALLLAVLLAACGGVGGSGNATPTPKPTTPAPTATPTPSVALQTYTGNGFTIGYPQGWKTQTVQQNAVNGIAFTDAQGINALTVLLVPNPGGVTSAADENKAAVTLVNAAAGLKSPQPVSLPTTTSVAGESWVQTGETGTINMNNTDVPGEVVVLTDNHPAKSPTTNAYDIYYGGPSLTFQQENQIFQAMLQSFKFTA